MNGSSKISPRGDGDDSPLKVGNINIYNMPQAIINQSLDMIEPQMVSKQKVSADQNSKKESPGDENARSPDVQQAEDQ